MTRGVRRLAFSKALSSRIIAGDVLVADSFVVAEPKTKKFLAALQAVTAESKVLIISSDFDDNTKLAARNVQPALLMTASEVNTEQLLKFKKIVITQGAMEQLAARTSK